MNWKIVGTSVRGSSHEKTGKPCQDCHGWIRFDNELFVAVADGAGSAEMSELGSSLAITAAMEMIQSQLFLPSSESEWIVLCQSALMSARQTIFAEASAMNISYRDMHSTLLLAVATQTYVVGVQVGDGAIVVGDNGNIQSITQPQTGEHINVTTFITSSDALKTMESVVWRGRTKYIAVFTDGLQMLALKIPAGTAHAPFFSPIFKFVANTTDEIKANNQLKSLFRSDRIRAKADDDITIVLAAITEEKVCKSS